MEILPSKSNTAPTGHTSPPGAVFIGELIYRDLNHTMQVRPVYVAGMPSTSTQIKTNETMEILLNALLATPLRQKEIIQGDQSVTIEKTWVVEEARKKWATQTPAPKMPLFTESALYNQKLHDIAWAHFAQRIWKLNDPNSPAVTKSTVNQKPTLQRSVKESKTFRFIRADEPSPLITRPWSSPRDKALSNLTAASTIVSHEEKTPTQLIPNTTLVASKTAVSRALFPYESDEEDNELLATVPLLTKSQNTIAQTQTPSPTTNSLPMIAVPLGEDPLAPSEDENNHVPATTQPQREHAKQSHEMAIETLEAAAQRRAAQQRTALVKAQIMKNRLEREQRNKQYTEKKPVETALTTEAKKALNG